MSRCQSMTLCQEEWRFLKRPSDKDREAHELTHLTTQPWCSVCVRAKGVDERHLRRPAGERAESQGVDHMPVIQFDCAFFSSVNEKGEQVRMRTILDTSTGYGTACAIDVKGGGDKYAISSAVSFLKELGTHDFGAGRIPSLRSRRCGCGHLVFVRCSRGRAILPEETIPESHASMVLWRANLSVATRRPRSIWVNRWCYSSLRAVACETRHLAIEQISAQTEWCDRVRKF